MTGYDILKAAHVTAIVLWIGSTVGALVALATPAPSPALGQRLRALMSAGLITTWLAGLALATVGGWFRSEWLQAKLALVLALTAAHGVIAGRLRRAIDGAFTTAVTSAIAIMATLATVFAIVLLVLAKPDL